MEGERDKQQERVRNRTETYLSLLLLSVLLFTFYKKTYGGGHG